MKPPRSLQGRALQWLAQREQSRNELRRKLLPHAVAELKAEAQAAAERAGVDDDGDRDSRAEASAASVSVADERASARARVEAVLDRLEAQQYLSPERFAESRVHARVSRFGNLRIQQELKQHQVSLSVDAAQALKDTELQRACAVLARKFAQPPTTTAERAKQARFLAGRGFSPEVIGKALRRDAAEQHATFEG